LDIGSRKLRLPLLVALVAAITNGSLSPATEAEDVAGLVDATSFAADEFLELFDSAVLPGLGAIGSAPPITGNVEVDRRIRAIAEERGYRRRPPPNRALVEVGDEMLQPEAAAAWASLQAAAATAGHSISIFSGYRSIERQVAVFVGKLTGTSDVEIETRVRSVAVPGYSKHHTGYAIDIRAAGGGDFGIRDTAAYAWLSANNFANTKAHGWIPSYPDGSGPAGPDPEPWEFVWVGVNAII
jgi:D-alanyl-D-alanine carboxypeptidase-like protein